MVCFSPLTLIAVVSNLKDICVKSIKIFPNVRTLGRDADNSETSKQINIWTAPISTYCVRDKKRVTERKEGKKMLKVEFACMTFRE